MYTSFAAFNRFTLRERCSVDHIQWKGLPQNSSPKTRPPKLVPQNSFQLSTWLFCLVNQSNFLVFWGSDLLFCRFSNLLPDKSSNFSASMSMFASTWEYAGNWPLDVTPAAKFASTRGGAGLDMGIPLTLGICPRYSLSTPFHSSVVLRNSRSTKLRGTASAHSANFTTSAKKLISCVVLIERSRARAQSSKK